MEIDPRFKGMRRLAAEVIISAIHDYVWAHRRLEGIKDMIFISELDKAEYKLKQRLEKRYAYRFLTSNSLWHEIIELRPEYVKRKLDQRDFKLFETILMRNQTYGGHNERVERSKRVHRRIREARQAAVRQDRET